MTGAGVLRAALVLLILVGAAWLSGWGRVPGTSTEVGIAMEPEPAGGMWTNRPWLPHHVDEWTGEPDPITERELEVLPRDTQFARMRYMREGSRFGLVNSVVLSGTSRGSIHRAEYCMQGQGWSSTQERWEVALSDGSTLPVTVLDMSKAVEVRGRALPQRAVYAYWFVGSHGLTADHVRRAWMNTVGRLRTGKNQRWAYVIVACVFPDDRDPRTVGEAREEVRAFISRSAPKYVLVR
jgi:hypothetical protein